MTFLLFVFGVILAVYGLVEHRDVVVLTGAFLAASAVALSRLGRGPRRGSTLRDG